MKKSSGSKFIPLSDWLGDIKKPVVIAGPCSAESEEQVFKTAKALAKIPGVKIFRSGVWKPRTSPHSFKGHGVEALKWLQNVKRETGLLTAVEVASPKHVELCLKFNIDIIWVGARTTVSPFSIEELTRSLEGIDIPVMVKNPLNPDLELWAGAIERFFISGHKKIIAIHRGFHTYEKTPYRNNPIWEIPIELKRRYPQLPFFCDPSHITGNPDFIEDISQKALNLDMCGLMIETHINPDSAISDAFQQITPARLKILLKKLSIPQKNEDFKIVKQLEDLRNGIDIVDNQILNLLKQRMDIVEKIGLYKKEHKITVLQIKRWNSIINERLTLAEKLGLNKDYIEKMLKILHEASILLQHQIINKK
ncbi:MAG: chorismate mutase [Bacteroidales bacterium]|nr:chorismate mutase [Bacteroidales bacterium]